MNDDIEEQIETAENFVFIADWSADDLEDLDEVGQHYDKAADCVFKMMVELKEIAAVDSDEANNLYRLNNLHHKYRLISYAIRFARDNNTAFNEAAYQYNLAEPFGSKVQGNLK